MKNVQGYRKAVYSKYRNPKPHVVSELRALGASALLPMIDELAFSAPARGDASDDDMRALEIGMIEALGSLRDGESRPVLHAIFASATSEGVRAAAARAIGKLGGDADLALLEKHLAPGDALREAAIDGLGECRRIESANDLVGVLASAQDEHTAELAARAAGTLGSSWAWKALGSASEKTGLDVRERLAKALVPEFVRWHGDARSSMSKAILMLDHPSLPDLIAGERAKADAETQRALDSLDAIVARHLNR